MADSKQPRIWVGFALDDVPFTSLETYRFSHRPLAGAIFIEGRIPSDGLGDLVRRASATPLTGEPAVDSCSVEFHDTDNLFRNLLTTNRRWFKNRKASVEMLSDTLLATTLTPDPGDPYGLILMNGVIRDFQPADDLMATMQIEDILAPYLDKTYPLYTIGDAYPYLFEESEDPPDETTSPGFNIPSQLRDQVLPIYYGPFLDTVINPLTGLPRGKGMIPVWFTAFTHLTAGTGTVGEPTPEQAALLAPFFTSAGWGGWGELVVALGEQEIPNVYTSNLGNPPRRVLNSADYGVTILAPGHPGWPFATNTVMRNDFELTVIYARGPLLWQHLTNEVNITVDVCGEKSPLSPYNPITQAGFAWQDFLIQHVLANGGTGYKSGPKIATVPTYGVGDRPMFQTDYIQAWQAMTATRLGNADGYLINMPLYKPTTLREILATFNRSFGTHNAKTSAGEHFIFSINDAADPTAGVPIRERIELKRLPAPRLGWDEVKNVWRWDYGWDPEQDKPQSITRTDRNQTSINGMQEEIPNSGVFHIQYTADNDTALDVMGRLILRLGEPPRYQNLPLDIGGVDRYISEQVPVSHRQGLGPEQVGYVNQPMVVMGMVQRKNDVTLEALDVGPIIANALNGPVVFGAFNGGGGGGPDNVGTGSGWNWETWPTDGAGTGTGGGDDNTETGGAGPGGTGSSGAGAANLFSTGWDNAPSTGCSFNNLTDNTVFANDYGPASSCSAPAIAEVVTAEFVSAPNSLRINMLSGFGTNGPDFRIGPYPFPPSVGPVYIRWREKFSSNYYFNTADHKMVIWGDAITAQDYYYQLRGNPGNTTARITVHYISGGGLFEVLSGPGSAVSRNVWHTFEARIVYGVNGSLQLRYDGSPVTLTQIGASGINLANFNNSGHLFQYAKLDTTYNGYDNPAVQAATPFYLWYDDFGAGTSDWLG
jgi:hypothetical protein